MKLFRPSGLDPGNQCLWRGEHRVPLTPKAFRVLRYLVEHPGRLVTQDELLEHCGREYVNPELIKKYILGIRKVLGDQHDIPFTLNPPQARLSIHRARPRTVLPKTRRAVI